MDSLIFSVNAIAPLVFTVAIGYFLRRIGIFTKEFAAFANKTVFKVFLPVMLFLNIYNINPSMNINPGYIIFAVSAILLAFAAALITVPFVTKDKNRKAPLMQAVFRSNYALIGVPLATAISPENGAAIASIVVIFTIPIFNILAVLLFSFYKDGEKPSIKKTLIGILKNPLIIGVALGALMLLVKMLLRNAGVTTELSDIPAIYKTLTYLSSIATPLALLALGAQFEFSAIGTFKKELIFGVLAKELLVPAAALFTAYKMNVFSPAEIACFIGIFATPLAVSTVPMTQEMGGDTALSGQLVVWTTAASSITVFFLTFIFREIGVF